MLSPLELYAVNMLDVIKAVFLIALVGAVLMALLASVNREFAKFRNRVCLIVVFASLFMFTPSTKQAASMLIVPAITSNCAVKIDPELEKLYNSWLEENIEINASEKTASCSKNMCKIR